MSVTGLTSEFFPPVDRNCNPSVYLSGMCQESFSLW